MYTSSSEPVAIDFSHVNKSYGNGPLVLEDFSMHIGAGELVTVLGPSGCGKTTMLRLLAGFEQPNSGDISVGGTSVTNTPANKRHMGMVFQSYSLFPNLSVTENIAYGLEIRKVAPATRQKRSEELLEMIGLAGFGERYPHQLSGGQQQRVALARALATEPSVLLLDEPLSALDAAVRVTLRDEIRRVQQTLGTTTLFITHDQHEALVIADKVAVMNKGKIEQYADPQTLYTYPETPFVARFVGSINEFSVPSSWDAAAPIPFEVEPGQATDTVFVRPENLQIFPGEYAQAVVRNQRYLGERTLVYVEHPGAREGIVTVSLASAQAGEFVPGTRVYLTLEGDIAQRRSADECAQAGV